ncbi:MAG: FMN-binding negative transcriptional regulator [Kiloniellales bacterium]|nr:FMN-binding negative transcriptional regulator [Kiloniellales bacterium]
MYVPDIFRIHDKDEIRTLIETYGFGLFVTARNSLPVATHIPILLDPAVGENGCLLAHMAKANPHWHDIEEMSANRLESLVIFQGPHAYVSPNNYASDKPNVPTWNYLAVHAYGIPGIVREEDRVIDILCRLSARHEKGFPEPWRLEEQPRSFISSMLRGIVAFEIPISRLEAKAKLNQNKPRAQMEAAAQALSIREDDLSRSTAEAMWDRLREG